MALGVYCMLISLCTLSVASAGQIHRLGRSTTCPAGFTNVNGTCYMFVRDERVTWDEASARCADRGAILAEPDTKQKIHDVLQITIDRTITHLTWRGWVGGTDRQTEGTWIWGGSGTPVDSSLFFPSQPDSGRGDEDCLMMGPMVYDAPCSWNMFYFCQTQATV